MKKRLIAGILLLALLPAASTAATVAKKPAPAKAANWVDTVNITPEGAYVIGNPAAKVKLVEYLSLTCPHCAHMAGEAMAPLKRDYIAKGLVSLEIRHAVRDGYDFAGSMLIRCQPRNAYLPSIEGLFATQAVWFEKAMAASNDPAFETMAPAAKMQFVAKAAGFDSYFAKRGMAPARFNACLADPKGQKALEDMADRAWNKESIPGTPAFRLNGEMLGSIASWSALEAKIKAALG
ncbi:DsbA family protein [Sphingomonas montanisoli]|uniref:Thioredoxin domain-containing protein n=1 Tax=Sphingomonas montanisoli TaxID=2606412 RepID=A0A5D9BYZ7_9SPHN|nr:thioredoxin domain-containing protein [Sphingomonas montanisoli]TZG24634.1 thioredoxin domain-containing protein [Sphingomonas montanisoli]